MNRLLLSPPSSSNNEMCKKLETEEIEMNELVLY